MFSLAFFLSIIPDLAPGGGPAIWELHIPLIVQLKKEIHVPYLTCADSHGVYATCAPKPAEIIKSFAKHTQHTHTEALFKVISVEAASTYVLPTGFNPIITFSIKGMAFFKKSSYRLS